MQITTESLQSLYVRAMEYTKARFGKEADEIHIQDDGMLKAIFGRTCMGEYDEDEEYIGLDVLNEDLEIAYKKRKEEEEKERLKFVAEMIKRKEQQKEYERQQQIASLKEFVKNNPEEAKKIFGGLEK